MNWEPSRADNSIERATIIVQFQNVLGADELDDLAVAARKTAHAHGLTDRFEPQPVMLPTPTGLAGAVVQVELEPTLQVGTSRRIAFRRVDADNKPVEEF